MKKLKEGEDRLSSLPDILLVSILHFLPIDSAAATSVLSRRWHYLWTQRHSILFPPSEKIDKYKNYEYFVSTVDHIISKLTFKIYNFTLRVPCFDDPKSSTFLLPWISKICRLNPKQIHLYLGVKSDKINSFQLPSCLFQTQSLSSLVLLNLHEIEFMLPSDGISLPKLRELHLSLDDSHIASLSTLCKSCPLLENLFIILRVRDESDVVVDIIAPNLKFLTLACKGRAFKLVIATFKLEKICFLGQLPFIHFVSNPFWLQKSSVDLMLCQGKESDDLTEVKGLYQQVSCVSSLDLGKSGPHLLNTINGTALPVFRNLVHLDLYRVKLNRRSRVPLGLLSNLKKIEVSKLVGNVFEMEFLEHVLSNAPVLEELHVCIDDRERDQLCTEYKFCRDLFLLLKSSLRCQIKFVGNRITASSNDFRNGVLTCQIVN